MLAAVLAVSGCGGSGAKQTPPASRPDAHRTSHNGAGPLVVPISAKTRLGLEQDLFGARFLSSTRLAIPGIAGSSNCPSVPDELVVRNPHAIRVDLVVGSWSRTPSGRRVEVPRSPGTCLDDLHPVPVVVSVDPSRIDVHRRLKVSLYFPRGAIRRSRRPVLVTVPPLAPARFREEIRVARSANPRLFSIFPKVPGARRCSIPDGSTQRRFAGICRTNVRPQPTMEPSWSVTFAESWWPHCPPMAACSPRELRHHVWQVGEGETVVTAGTKPRVGSIRSRGAKAPQQS